MSQTPVQTSRSLPIALLRSREVVMRPIREHLKKIGLTEQKWRVLRSIEEMAPCEQSAIAHDACLLLPSLSRIIQSLETDGFIKREGDDKDKRRAIVSLMPKGQNILNENRWLYRDIEAEIEKRFGRDELKTLLDLLEKFQRL